MAIDFFAIATDGFYPTPTPTDVKRMGLAATWGYLVGSLPLVTGVVIGSLLPGSFSGFPTDNLSLIIGPRNYIISD